MKAAVLGLREQNKRRTRAALSEAALQLVADEGFEALTADRLAAAAGVSRRTVFNYFPRVESVLYAGVEEAAADLVAAFVGRPADEGLHDSMRAVLFSLVDSDFMKQARMIQRAAQHSPDTRRVLHEFMESQTEALETALRHRIGPRADPVYVATFAAATSAVIARIVKMPAEDGTDADPDRLLYDRLRRSVDLLFTGFDETGAVTGSQGG